MRLQKLRARAFRGLTSLDLELAGRGLVLFGENGTGKSSVVDAIECALTGSIGHLQHIQALSFARNAHHVSYEQKELEATAVVGSLGKTFELAKGKSKETDESLANHLGTVASKTFILRRQQLLSFIYAQEAERYKALYPFIGITQYSSLERKLRSLKNNATASADTATRTKDIFHTSLRTSFPGVEAGSNICSSISKKLIADINAHLELSLDDLDVLGAALREQADGLPSVDSLIKLREASAAEESVREQLSSLNFEPLRQALQNVRAMEVDLHRSFHEKVLREGKLWLEEWSEEECPLCESTISRANVLERIQVRLTDNEKLIDARNQLASEFERLKSSLLKLNDCYQDAKKKHRLAPGHKSWQFARAHKMLAETLARGIEAGISGVEQLDDLKSLVSNLQLPPSLKLSDLDSTDQEELERQAQTLAQLIHSLAEFKKASEAYELACEEHDRITTLESICSAVHECAVEARKAVSKKLLGDIQERIEVIYNEFHPGERIFLVDEESNIILDINPDRQGSAYLKTNFGPVRAEDPRGFFSESHLDTLGLAIFLALRERDGPGTAFGLMVLDDILTSLDGAHRGRVTDFLLQNYASKYQLVITTHDRIWYDTLLRHNLLKSNLFVLQWISDWSLSDGAKFKYDKNSKERLVESITEDLPEVLGTNAGRFLEFDLLEMRYSLLLAIKPKKGENYTIGDIFPKFWQALLKNPNLSQLITSLMARMENNQVRNYATHADEWKRGLTQTEAREFGKDTLELHDLICCPTCSNYVYLDEESRDIRCRCGHLHYGGRSAL